MIVGSNRQWAGWRLPRGPDNIQSGVYTGSSTVSPAGLEVGQVGEKTQVRIRSSSLQSAGMGGSDAHPSFFAHLSHLGPSVGDFKASRQNCTSYNNRC